MAEENPRKWTIMIYMAGDNNLSEECVYALTEMKAGLLVSEKLAVTAQFDPSGVRTRTRRYRLKPSAMTSLEEDATPWTASETNTGEPANLLDFIRWGISEYQAENYMVVLVGHGSGTDDDFLLRDENPSDALSIAELQEVFKKITEDGHKIAILGMDTCLMNMAEVCYELSRTDIQYIVGSEGFSPNTGWPYKSILQELIRKINAGGANPDWLAKLIVDQYVDFYHPYIAGGISVDQSALVREKSPLLTQAVTRLAAALRDEIKNGELGYFPKPPSGDAELPRNKPKQNALLLAHWEAQSFNGEVFVDLFDFSRLLRSRYLAIPTPENAPVPRACNDVMTAIRDLVLKSCYSGAAFQYAFGVSIYFPWAEVLPTYENLAFPKETKWFDFLKEYVQVTRRPPNPAARFTEDVGRASVPTNKGRDGKVESMRNPPFEPSRNCNDSILLDRKRQSTSARRRGSPRSKKKTTVTHSSRKKR